MRRKDETWLEMAADYLYHERDGVAYSLLRDCRAEKREVIFDLLFEVSATFRSRWWRRLAHTRQTQVQVKKQAITELRKYVDKHKKELGWHFAPAPGGVRRGSDRWVMIVLNRKLKEDDIDIIHAARIGETKGRRTIIKRFTEAYEDVLAQSQSPVERAYLLKVVLSMKAAHENLVYYERMLAIA